MRNYLRNALLYPHRDGDEGALGGVMVPVGLGIAVLPLLLLPDTTTLIQFFEVETAVALSYLLGVLGSKIGMAFLFRGMDNNDLHYARRAISVGSWAWPAHLGYHLIAAPISGIVELCYKVVGSSNNRMERLTERIMTPTSKALPKSREE